MKILGIDPGSQYTGYGLIESHPLNGSPFASQAGRWVLKKEKTLASKLVYLGDKLQSFLSRERPDLVVLERVFMAMNAHSALILGHVRGLILFMVSQNNIPIQELAVTSAKKIIGGRGRSSKEQVAQMLAWQLAQPHLIHLPPDATDALALSLAGFWQHRSSEKKLV